MKYQWKINDNEVDIEINKAADGRHLATIGQTTYSITSHRISPEHWYAEINGQGFHFYVNTEGTVRHIACQGHNYRIEDRSIRRRQSQQTHHSGEITPPMPGSIVRVLVKEGQSIDAGQELIVLSAMKMETTLYAPHAGTIEKILVKEGQQVMPGQQLFAITPSEPNPSSQA